MDQKKLLKMERMKNKTMKNNKCRLLSRRLEKNKRWSRALQAKKEGKLLVK